MLVDHRLPLGAPPRPWRLSARLLVVHASRLLLIRAFDPTNHSAGEWFEIPGGGLESGEDTATAAIRETAEETGYVVPARYVGEACWRGETTYLWLGRRHWAEIVMHLARVGERLRQQPTAWVQDEQACFLEPCWLPVDEILAGRWRFFPGTLPLDLPRLLAGERIDAGFTAWS